MPQGKPLDQIQSAWTSMTALSEGLGIPLSVLKADKRSGCPAFRTNGSVHLPTWIRWHFEQDGPATQQESYTEAKARETREKANILEIDRKEREGALVPIEKIESYIQRWVTPVAQRLRSQPDRLSNLVNPADPGHAREMLIQERRELFALGWLADDKTPVKKVARKRPAKKAAKKATKKAARKKGKKK